MSDIYDVFFSYAHADLERAQEIVHTLRSTGLVVWFDETNISDFASITQSIEKGIAKSKALLAYYSSAYSVRRPCQWELTAAFLAALRDGDPQGRVLVINPENGSTHIQPINLRDAKFRKAPTPTHHAAMRTLAESIKEHLSALDGPLGDIQSLKPTEWFGTRGFRYTRFVGRLPELWQIHSLLHGGDMGLITGLAPGGIAQVTGLAGTGKSLLVQEYALRFGAAFPGGVFWLRAFGNDDSKVGFGPKEREAERQGQIRDFAAGLGIPAQDRTPVELEGALAREIERRDLPCLWVVDDLASGLDVQSLHRWFAPHPLAKTLLTTRSREYSAMAGCLDLGVLPADDAYELLTSRRAPKGESEIREARGLVHDLGCHALAVDVTGARLAAAQGLQSFAELRSEVAREDTDALELAATYAEVLPTGHQASITKTVLQSIHRAESPARDFLRLASVLATAPIPPRLVAAVFQKVDSLAKNDAEQRTLLALRSAEGLSLANKSDEDEGAFWVHTLVARTMRLGEPDSSRRNALRSAVIALLSNLLSQTVTDPRSHAEIRFEIAHARELSRKATDHAETELLGWVATYDFVRGAYQSAYDMFFRQYEVFNEVLGPEHPSTLGSASNLALALWKLGNLARARKVTEKVLEAQIRLLGKEHPKVLRLTDGLAEILRGLNDLVGARMLQQESLHTQVRLFGVEHPSTLVAMNNLALTLVDSEQYGEAENLQKEVLDIQGRLLGRDHPDTLRSMHNLAVTLMKEGKLELAKELQDRALKARLLIMGEEHPDTLNSINMLAEMLEKQGDLAGARERFEQVLAVRRRVLGPGHPATLQSIDLLSSISRRQGSIPGAQKLQEEALDLRREVLGSEHPDTLRTMNDLAMTLYAREDMTGARELHEQTLKSRLRVLGREHRDTLDSMNNLAVTLRKQNELPEARALLDEVVKVRQKTLGQKHPATLVAMNNLALLSARRDRPRALKLLKKVCELQRQVLGSEHPDTLMSMSNVADILGEQHELKRALDLHRQVLKGRQRALGNEHPDTSTSALKVFRILFASGQQLIAKNFLLRELAWLLQCDPTTLGADQRAIREVVAVVASKNEAQKP